MSLTAASLWFVCMVLSGAEAPEAPEVVRALISLEAQTEALSEVLEPNPRDVIAIQLHRARVAWHSDPAATAALFNLVLRNTYSGEQRDRRLFEAARAPDPTSIQFNQVMRRALPNHERTHLLIEAARAEAAVGYLQASLKHYLAAIALAANSHHVASAFEGFVAVAERAGVVPAVPPTDSYIKALSFKGELDTVGWETVYRLGRLLIRRGDPRGLEVISAIPDDVPAGRRALYIRATRLLQAGERENARALFERAANLPPYPAAINLEPERDAAVVELAWLALGRLAFEAGDKEAGIVAYQQIAVDSPRFLEAYYELGWLAMESGDEGVASSAFVPVVELGAHTEYGRKAKLLRGYLLLGQGKLDAAEAHYDIVSAEFGQSLKAFDAAVTSIADLGDLARDCEVRQQALENPLLQQVLAHDGVKAAREMAIKLAEIGTLGFVLTSQIEEVDRMLAGQGPMNPLKQIKKDRRAIEGVLRSVDQLSLTLERTAAGQRWLAGTNDNELGPQCCAEPRLRVAKLRTTLEGFIAELDRREASLRASLIEIRNETRELKTSQETLYAELVTDVNQAQVDAVAMATQKEREHLYHMVMEGEAGVLEAVWQKKEQNLASIIEAIETRKDLLDKLANRYREVLAEQVE